MLRTLAVMALVGTATPAWAAGEAVGEGALARIDEAREARQEALRRARELRDARLRVLTATEQTMSAARAARVAESRSATETSSWRSPLTRAPAPRSAARR